MTVLVRAFLPCDADVVAALVQRCLREVNSRDYSSMIIDKMCAHFRPDRFNVLAESRDIYVAAEQTGVVGTVSRDGNKVFTMFVDPDVAGTGIGRALMEHIEVLAAGEGHGHMETGASITGHDFYLRLGYTDVRESETDFGFNWIMHKPLSAL